MKSYFSIITLALISFSSHAALNKWVDSEGKIHYSDTVPPEASATQSVRNIAGKGSGESPSSGYSPKSLSEREAELRKSRLAKEKDSEKKAEQDARAETKSQNCEAARHNAKAIEDGMRIVTYDANGERTIMDDEARAKKLEESRQAISKNCN
jgi:hypothetical protein